MDQGIPGALRNIQQNIETQNVCIAPFLNFPGNSDIFVCQKQDESGDNDWPMDFEPDQGVVCKFYMIFQSCAKFL